MKNLAPHIFRQRLIIEGFAGNEITVPKTKKYLARLAKVLKMIRLDKEPTARIARGVGISGWVRWKTSGSHFYYWFREKNFFSCDIYTCKRFSPKKAVSFTKRFFNCSQIVFKEG